MIGAVITGRKMGSAFDCLNRHDLPAFLLAWVDEGTFIYPSTVSVGGKMGCKSAAARWFQGFMEQFPNMNFTVKDFCLQDIFSFGGTNVASIEWDCTGTNRDGKDF